MAEEGDAEGDGNELLVDLESKDEKRERETSMWFSKVGGSVQLFYACRFFLEWVEGWVHKSALFNVLTSYLRRWLSGYSPKN